MKTIVNTTSEAIEAYFNGQNIVFKPGQKKAFEDGPATEIVRENNGIVFEKDVVEVDEPVEVIVNEPAKKVKKKEEK